MERCTMWPHEETKYCYSSKNTLYFQRNYKPLPYESLLVFNYKLHLEK